eukprot:Em0001g250a
MGNKTPVPPEVSEREKSPDKVPEREKSPGLPAPKTIHHALTEGTPVTGVSSEEAETETSPTSTPISATAGTEAAPLPKEVPGTVLPQNDCSRTRQADILVTNWDNGISAAFDITVASPLNSSVMEAGMYSGVAARAAEFRKHSENDTKCAQLSWKCIPLVGWRVMVQRPSHN